MKIVFKVSTFSLLFRPKLAGKISTFWQRTPNHLYLYWVCEPWPSGLPLSTPCLLPSVSLANSSPACPFSASHLVSRHSPLQLPHPSHAIHCHGGPWHWSLLSVSYHVSGVFADTFQPHQSPCCFPVRPLHSPALLLLLPACPVLPSSFT